MRETDIQRLKAVLLYLLNRMPDGTRDVYHIVKTAFFAQRYHFVRYAVPLFNDQIVALDFGPVPSLVYNILKVARGQEVPRQFCDERVLRQISPAIGYEDEFFTAKERPDMSCLSKSNIECLDDAIMEASKMTFSELVTKTHGAEWDRAYHSTSGHKMDDLNVAREGGASEDMIAYLAEALEIDRVFC